MNVLFVQANFVVETIQYSSLCNQGTIALQASLPAVKALRGVSGRNSSIQVSQVSSFSTSSFSTRKRRNPGPPRQFLFVFGRRRRNLVRSHWFGWIRQGPTLFRRWQIQGLMVRPLSLLYPLQGWECRIARQKGVRMFESIASQLKIFAGHGC